MPLTPERAIAADPELSNLQKILLSTDGTVTQLLEICSGEQIRVQKLEQSLVSGGPAPLQAAPGEQVISRRILLRGATRAYMYAHTWLVASRLPPGMSQALLETDTPIGQLWRRARLETYREIVEFRRETDASLAGLFGVDAPLLARSYLIHAGGAPMGLIVEKFPANLFM